jgi:hypothetical protein
MVMDVPGQLPFSQECHIHFFFSRLLSAVALLLLLPPLLGFHSPFLHLRFLACVKTWQRRSGHLQNTKRATPTSHHGALLRDAESATFWRIPLLIVEWSGERAWSKVRFSFISTRE